jgi:hypothetical protein
MHRLATALDVAHRRTDVEHRVRYFTESFGLSSRSWMPSDQNSVCALSNQNGAYNMRKCLYSYSYALFQEKSSIQILERKER